MGLLSEGIVDRRLMILDLWKSLRSAVLNKNGKIP